jgi:phospholipid-binding lipoprotein MlaA
MYTFNEGVDRAVLKPVATAYADYLPQFLRDAIGNVFGNIGDVWTSVNNFLQGKPREGANDLLRVMVNTTIGLGGLIDVGTHAGLPKHDEDFGQTLGVWGVRSGPYLVLPIFGSSTVRDGVAKPVDWYGDPLSYVENTRARNIARVVRLVDDRAAVLGTSSLLEDAAFDPYQFVRDAYLQRRENRIWDGEARRPAGEP